MSSTAPHTCPTPSFITGPGRFTRGMTLVEVLLGMSILTLTSLSILAGLLQGRRIAESNLLEETAFVIAQSYLEELKGVAYSSFETPAIPIGVRGGGFIPATPAVRRVDFKGTPGIASDDLRIEMTPTVTQTTSPTPLRPVSAYELQLTYTWRAEGNTAATTTPRTLRVIRSAFTGF